MTQYFHVELDAEKFDGMVSSGLLLPATRYAFDRKRPVSHGKRPVSHGKRPVSHIRLS